MAESITAFRIDITPKGGFIKGTTTNGSFQLGPLEYPLIAAIATVVNGPNPEYDSNNKIFSCKNQLQQDLANIQPQHNFIDHSSQPDAFI